MLNLSALNPQQRLAVETVHGPVMVLAGAGTGKTRVITYRIGHLIEKGVAPGDILAVTFTNKAAREMFERVRSLIPRNKLSSAPPASNRATEPGKVSKPTLCTFHALCARILRRHIEALGYKRNFVIFNESEQLGFVRRILSRISIRGEKVDPVAVLSQLSRLKSGSASSPAGGDDTARALAAHIRPSYESALRACNAVDFDDLLLLTLRLFDEQPEALAACRAQYRYVMVDEYQDTNAAQFELVHALTREHRNLCVVGDDDQSIYSWRGAQISNLLDMERHFPGLKVIKLEQNYRSTNTILSAANALIQHNARRRAKNLWSQKGDGPRITLHTFSDDEAEARGIVEEVDGACRLRQRKCGDIAILFRTNAQSRPIEMALRKASVRYHLIGGQSFFDRREIRDLLSYLRMFVNPDDEASLLRIANSPPRGLSDRTMEQLLAASHERKCAVFETMKNPAVLATFAAKTRGCIERFTGFIEQTRASLLEPGQSLAPWADHFLDEIGYFEDLRRGEKTPEAAEGRIRTVKDLVASLDGLSGAQPANAAALDRLQDFLEAVALDSERDEAQDKPEDAVTLITMHSCKGLEFPHVYIVGMEEGLLPHSRSAEEGSLDEERRLFYVSITRAMQTLAISHCAGRRKYGQAMPRQPSSFLRELPPDLIEHADEKAKTPVTVEAGKDRFAAMRQSLELVD